MSWVHYAPIQRQGTNQNPTAGAVLFAGSLGALDSDDTNLHWDNTNKRLGIGTAGPAAPLHVNASGAVLPQARFEAPGAGIANIALLTNAGADRLDIKASAGGCSVESSEELSITTLAPVNILFLTDDQERWSIQATGELVGNANFIRLTERADPAAPAANNGVIYMRDNGGGKTQLVARFPTGAVQVIATEP